MPSPRWRNGSYVCWYCLVKKLAQPGIVEIIPIDDLDGLACLHQVIGPVLLLETLNYVGAGDPDHFGRLYCDASVATWSSCEPRPKARQGEIDRNAKAR